MKPKLLKQRPSKIFQIWKNGRDKPSKWSSKTSQIKPKWGQEGARTAIKSKNNIDPTKKGAALHSPPPFWRKMWPTWPQLGSQDGIKMEKKSMQKSIKNLMHLEIDFWKDLGGFWEGKWRQVGTQKRSKIEAAAKAEKPAKH